MVQYSAGSLGGCCRVLAGYLQATYVSAVHYFCTKYALLEQDLCSLAQLLLIIPDFVQ